MKKILKKITIKAIFFLGLVVFSLIVAALAAYVSPMFFILLPIDTRSDLDMIIKIVFAVIAAFFILINIGRNQAAADKFYEDYFERKEF